jgi:hypothetical protein
MLLGLKSWEKQIFYHKLPLDKLEQLFYIIHNCSIRCQNQSMDRSLRPKEIYMNRNGMTSTNISRVVRTYKPSRGLLFGILILGALVAFEIFNYTTTDFALTDLLGNLRFAGLRWATILAVAFCGIDFAGIARLFTPQRGAGEPKEVWYLFGAWLLAASMNAMLTWWGVAIAVLGHESLGGTVVSRETMLKVVPIFVAIMVWVIRVLIIGSFSMTGDRLFSQASPTQRVQSMARQGQPQPIASPGMLSSQPTPYRAASKGEPQPVSASAQTGHARSEPTYQPISMSAANSSPNLTRK